MSKRGRGIVLLPVGPGAEAPPGPTAAWYGTTSSCSGCGEAWPAGQAQCPSCGGSTFTTRATSTAPGLLSRLLGRGAADEPVPQASPALLAGLRRFREATAVYQAELNAVSELLTVAVRDDGLEQVAREQGYLFEAAAVVGDVDPTRQVALARDLACISIVIEAALSRLEASE